MEIGKIEKVDLKSITIRSTASPLRVKLEGMQAGEGFVVSNIERGTISNMTTKLRPKKFVTRMIAIGSYRVIRVS